MLAWIRQRGKVHESDHRTARVIIREMGPLLDFNVPWRHSTVNGLHHRQDARRLLPETGDLSSCTRSQREEMPTFGGNPRTLGKTRRSGRAYHESHRPLSSLNSWTWNSDLKPVRISYTHTPGQHVSRCLPAVNLDFNRYAARLFTAPFRQQGEHKRYETLCESPEKPDALSFLCLERALGNLIFPRTCGRENSETKGSNDEFRSLFLSRSSNSQPWLWFEQ